MPLTTEELFFVQSSAYLADGDADYFSKELLPELSTADPTVLLALAGQLSLQGAADTGKFVAGYACQRMDAANCLPAPAAFDAFLGLVSH